MKGSEAKWANPKLNVGNCLITIIYIIIIGTVGCIKPIDSAMWVKAFLDESVEPQPFYSDEFKEWADDILEEDFDLIQEQITSLICKELYLYLVSMEE